MEDILVSLAEHRILSKYKSNLEGQYSIKLNMPQLNSSDLSETQDVIFVSILGNEQNISNVKKFLKKKMEASKAQEEKNIVSVITLNSDSDKEPEDETSTSKIPRKKGKRKKRKAKAAIIDLASPLPAKMPNLNTTIDLSESVCEDRKSSPLPPLPDFIPLSQSEPDPPAKDFTPFISAENRLASTSSVAPHEGEDIIILSSEDEEEVPRPIVAPPKLRPVVIDGSNVARLHGKPSNTYSCKGIKICVEYFLNRGHTQVTAFVPLFRRHCKRGIYPTIDEEILEELEKTQHVVFTPSRRVEGKSYACYDDRFIVELAASNGGVILSNDNFKDLLDVSPEFKETILKRLLMFCFVGDKLMIPDDPLGVGGPRLSEFLSFPPS